ncbi:hypothetical protein F4678DRAFT_433536 [Xylaria arbuscula]|nr:hypothetical protein F4678DRAFT_433536 [Xylaria arbuscula]
MRITIFLGALSALSAIRGASAIPLKRTEAVTFHSSENTTTYETYGVPLKIPVATKKCLGHKLSKKNFLSGKEQMIAWSEHGGTVVPGGRHAESYPNATSGVTWYNCNCKYFYFDSVPRSELDQVQKILEGECGKWQSGWVWSKEWEKGYNVVPTEWFRAALDSNQPVCPPACAFW